MDDFAPPFTSRKIARDDDLFRFRRGLGLLEKHRGPTAPGTVWLDLGCNDCQLLRLLVRDRGIAGFGIDAWDEERRVPSPEGSFGYRQADLEEELPWTGPVQVISAFEVIEHIVDTDGFLDRIYDALDPGGWVALSTPNINSLRNRVIVPLGRYPAGPEWRTLIHHVRVYNAGVLRQQLEAIGFENVRMRGVAFLPFSKGLGDTRASEILADAFPTFCGNIIAVARKPARD